MVELSFEVRGCAISQASDSIMVESLHGKSVETCREIMQRFKQLVEGQSAAADDFGALDEMSDMAALGTIHRFPARRKCALLAWDTLANALKL